MFGYIRREMKIIKNILIGIEKVMKKKILC